MVALKLLYGLDGRQRAPVPHALLPPPPAPSWQSWAAAVYQRIADPCPFPVSVEQVHAGDGTKSCFHALLLQVDTFFLPSRYLVQGLLQTLQLSPTEQRTYVDYLRKHVFGQVPPPPDLQELQVRFLLHCFCNNMCVAGCGKMMTDADLRPRLPQASLDAQSQLQWPAPQQSVPVQHSRLGALAAGAADGSQPASEPQPAAPVPHADQAAVNTAQGGQAAAAEPPSAADSAADDAAGSVMYTSTMNMKAGLAGHPDYLAVLTVVAALGWVTPLSLHRLVVALERDMMEAEVGQTVQ